MSTLLEWKDAYRTGISSVDYEHKSLIELLNELYGNLRGEPGKREVLDFLGEVHAKIAAHFALEETIMREAGYDEYAAHKAEHEQLLDEISDIMEDVEKGHYQNYDEVLARHLRDWFGEHFKTKDARLHRVLG